MANKHDPLRRFVAAALCDFLGYLDNRSDPIIVGGQYSKDKVAKVLADWCIARGISVQDADAQGWLAACKTGKLRLEDTDDSPE